MSLFRRQTCEKRARRIPKLTARAKESGSSLTPTVALSAKRSAVLSDDPLSTITISEGIPADRIEVEGRGESQPVAPNETPDGQRQNRRVEFEILPTP